MALSFNPKRLYNFALHDLLGSEYAMERPKTTVPYYAQEEIIQRPNTTIALSRMTSPLQDKVNQMAFNRKGPLSIQTSFNIDHEKAGELMDSPIVRSQNPLLQSPISRSQNPMLDTPVSGGANFLDSNGKFLRRASCLSTSTSTSSFY
eukprot:NODE_441_length_8548_cov_0.413185.p4 type:complete len:148 gc:universal NODE_441_length_8548_cov_0.413185:8184-7741(-)